MLLANSILKQLKDMRVIFQMFYDPLQGKKVNFNPLYVNFNLLYVNFNLLYVNFNLLYVNFNLLYVNFIFIESFGIYYNIEDCKDCKAQFTTGPLIDLRFEI